MRMKPRKKNKPYVQQISHQKYIEEIRIKMTKTASSSPWVGHKKNGCKLIKMNQINSENKIINRMRMQVIC